MKWGQLSALLGMKSMKQHIPLIGEFELTGRCNLGCKMCYMSHKIDDSKVLYKEPSAKEWIELAREARDMGMLFILLTGGEVFARSDFREIYSEISMMGLTTTIYSNGTLITPQIASWLGSRPPSQIEITLYGASQESYEKICGNGDGFHRALRGIDLLLDQGVNLQIRTTVVKDNIHEFEKMKEIAGIRGIKLGVVNYVSPRRDHLGKNYDEMRLSPKELVDLEEIHSAAQAHQANLSEPLSEDSLNIHKELLEIGFQEDDPFPCSCGKNTFWVTWDGRMVPCSIMNKPEAYPFEEGFLSAWESLIRQCSQIPKCKECSACDLKEYCMTCPARLMNETGSYEVPASYLCQCAKERKKREGKNYENLHKTNN